MLSIIKIANPPRVMPDISPTEGACEIADCVDTGNMIFPIEGKEVGYLEGTGVGKRVGRGVGANAVG